MTHRRNVLRWLAAAGAGSMLPACGGGEDTATPPPPPTPLTRTWRMGFSPNPPRLSAQSVIQGIDIWSTRAEVVIIHEDLPWTELLAGVPAQTLVERDKLPLVQYLRTRNLTLYYMLDLTDGLARESEAPALRAAGRTLADPAVQALARDFGLAVERVLAPEYLGLAAETNLVRLAAPAALYGAVRDTANLIETALRAAGPTSKRFISVQVETAWGRIGGGMPYAGVEQDFTDFAFMHTLGLSSYPYFGYTQPEDLPIDYYSRLLNAGRYRPW